MVAPIDLGEIAALAEFREPLEITAVRLACTRATDSDLDTVAALLDSCRSDAPREALASRPAPTSMSSFARLSGNPFVLKAVRGVMTRLARARWLEVLTEASREQAWTEHRCILAFIRQRLPNAAAREAAAHVQATRDRLLQSLDQDRRGLRARGFAVVGQRLVGPDLVGPDPVGQDLVGQAGQ